MRRNPHAKSDSLERSAPLELMLNRPLVRVLARSFVAGEISVEPIVARASQTLGHSWRWLRPLAQRYVKSTLGQTRSRHLHNLSIEQWLTEPHLMQPVAAAQSWDVPAIESVGALSEWLQLTPGDLEWFADLKRLGYKRNRAVLRHYHYRVLGKAYDSVRLIEAPKPRLQGIQRQILAGILEKIPFHPAAHGFVKDRSIETFVAPHVAQRVVLRIGFARLLCFHHFRQDPGRVPNSGLSRIDCGPARGYLHERCPA